MFPHGHRYCSIIPGYTCVATVFQRSTKLWGLHLACWKGFDVFVHIIEALENHDHPVATFDKVRRSELQGIVHWVPGFQGS
jgi:hypothetical protein